jgi:hypothetical protein
MTMFTLIPFASSVVEKPQAHAYRFSTSLETNGNWNQEIAA